jgi:fructose 1,6-bisphosphate aldolase/phosphatase
MEKVHALAWETFEEATKVAKKLELYGAGQDLLADAFSGNIRGMGRGVAEMEINERTATSSRKDCPWRIWSTPHTLMS